jgi:hypothetical protein
MQKNDYTRTGIGTVAGPMLPMGSIIKDRLKGDFSD